VAVQMRKHAANRSEVFTGEIDRFCGHGRVKSLQDELFVQGISYALSN
jgi:hypothetical protein